MLMPQHYWKSEPKPKHKKMSKVVKHLKGDIKTFKHEAQEDRELIHELKKNPKHHSSMAVKKTVHHNKKLKQSPKAKNFIEKRMHEFKEGEMHSRVKKTGPKVTNPKQAIAIALSEARKKGMKVSKKRK